VGEKKKKLPEQVRATNKQTVESLFVLFIFRNPTYNFDVGVDS
jgi:hypothetical protein